MGLESPPEKLPQPWSCHPAEPPVPHLRKSRALRLLLPRGPAPGNVVLWAQLLYFSGHCCYAWLCTSQRVAMELSDAAACAPPYPTGQWLNWTGFLLVCLPHQRDAQKTTPKVKTWVEVPQRSVGDVWEDNSPRSSFTVKKQFIILRFP